jgi:site-specific recombinase XerD
MRSQQKAANQGADESLLQQYEQSISRKAEGTIDAYVRTTRLVMVWVAQCPGNGGHFRPRQLTKTAVEEYLVPLEQEGFSLNRRAKVKSTISSFARWLMEEKGLLQRNPTRRVDLLHNRYWRLASFQRISGIFCARWSSKWEIGTELLSSRWAIWLVAG